MTPADRPRPALSVVIASVNGPPMIQECLAALSGQAGEVPAEVIVVDATDEQTRLALRREFPWVHLIAVDDRQTIPALRATGLRHAHGGIVAVIEDHCVAERHWYAEILAAHRRHPECVAIGGAVENGSTRRLVDWAVYFCEYSRYMRPLPAGLADEVPGNNVSYKRRAFADLADLDVLLRDGFWESTLHERLRRRGERFALEPSIVVYHKKRFGFAYYVRQRYHYSRYYASLLTRAQGFGRRLARSLASAGLPPLLLTRIVRQVLRKRSHVRELALSLPLVAIFTGVWAVGEAVGCLFGAGRSLLVIE